MSATRAAAAVDVKDFAGHEPRRLEVGDCVDDVGDLIQVADRVQEIGLPIRGTGCIGDLVTPGAIAFIRWPSPRILDRERIGPAIQARFVSDAGTDGTPAIA